MVYTRFIAVYDCILQIQKVCITSGIEPCTLCILASILNHYATSVIPWDTGYHSKRYKYIGFAHNTLCHLVAGVWRPAPAPGPQRLRLPLRPWRHRDRMPKCCLRHCFVEPQTWTDNHSLQVTYAWTRVILHNIWFVRSLPWAGGPPHRPGGPQFIFVTRAMQG